MLVVDLLEYLRANGFNFTPYHALQDKKPPYFVYEVDSKNFDGVCGKTILKDYLCFFYIYAKSFKEVNELSERFEEVLYGFKKQPLDFEVQSDFEDETSLYLQKIFFKIIY